MKMKISNIGIPFWEINPIKSKIGIDKDLLLTIIYDEIKDLKYEFYFFFQTKNADYDILDMTPYPIEYPDYDSSPYHILENLKKIEEEVIKNENIYR